MTDPFAPPPNLPVPSPWSDADYERVSHTRLRRRMLTGRWRDDLTEAVEREVGDVRRAAWGLVDISANPFRASCSALAALYDVPGEVTADDPEAGVMVADALKSAGFWQLMQRVQRDTIGMREMVVVPEYEAAGERAEEEGDEPHLMLRAVPPDLIWAQAHPMEPDEPVVLVETTMRDGVWGYDLYSVVGGVGVFRRYSESKELVEELAGEEYPAKWRWQDGRPFIPHVLYHASRSGELFDPYEGIEIVEGTMRLGVLYTFYGHCVKQASWPQRYMVNVRPSGSANAMDGDQLPGQQREKSHIVTDPAAVLSLDAIEDAGQPMVGSWQTSSDPNALLESILAYERRIFAMAGLSPADAQRVAGDPRSGFALAINQENKRADQQRYAPSFRRGDESLAERVGAMMGMDPAEYTVRYGFEMEAAGDSVVGDLEAISAALAAGDVDLAAVREDIDALIASLGSANG